MERLRRTVKQIAHAPPSRRWSTLSPLQLSLIPLLSLASSLYRLALSLRRHLYHLSLLPTHRLAVPVISVGNLTWGGNGKTPMVEFLARWFADAGISSLILTRGYGGADEAKMLQRHLHGTSAKIGVGANRAATAAIFLERFGNMNPCGRELEKLLSDEKTTKICSTSGCIGAAILDDGMQHLSLWRNLEIVMVNAMMPWGNCQLLPLGPLREPLTALERADVVIIHHTDLVVKEDVEAIISTIRMIKRCLLIFFTKMAPSHFFKVGKISSKVPLDTVHDRIVLCVSGVGFAGSFIQQIKKMGPKFVDSLDFSDHQLFQLKDIEMIRERLQALQIPFAAKPIAVVTEKDYDRAPKVLQYLEPYDVLVLCSALQFLAHNGSTEAGFKRRVMEKLKQEDRA